ncbi:nucleotidyltransferase domain-containing protein [Patescibacteria group bacterium]|nr:MAG: nucleotidyltransferase domain-containing protein [Patescibacteria group bacterium]
MKVINSTTKTAIKKAAKQAGLDFVVLFGSAARGKTHKYSDIDIAVKTKGPISYYEEAGLRENFCHIFGRGDVEVVNARGASPLLMLQIGRDGVPLYEDKVGEFAKFRMYAFKRYVEAKPLYELRHKQLQKFLA